MKIFRPTLALIMMIAIYAVVMNIISPYVTTLAEELGTESFRFRNIFAVFFIGFTFIAVVGGHLGHKVSNKALVVAGGLIVGSSMWLFNFASTFATMTLVVLWMGMGGGLLEVFSTAGIAQMYYPDNRKMMSFSQMFFCLGAVIIPIVSSFFIKHNVSRNILFSGCALISLISVIYLAGCSFPKYIPENHHNESATTSSLWRQPVFYLAASGMFLYVTAELAVSSWICVFFEQGLNSSKVLAANMLSLYWGGMLIGRAGSLFLPHSIGDAVYIRNSLLLALAAIVLMNFTTSVPLMACLVFVFALGEGAVWPTVMSLASKRFPHRSSLAIGLIAASGTVGAILGPYFMGFLAAKYSFGPQIMLFPAAVVVVNIATFSLIGKLIKKDRP
jgi:MFS transporter, FHS family, glucose/mannose:H+ symporter